MTKREARNADSVPTSGHIPAAVEVRRSQWTAEAIARRDGAYLETPLPSLDAKTARRVAAADAAAVAHRDAVAHTLTVHLRETIAALSPALRIPANDLETVFKSTLRRVPIGEKAHDWTQYLAAALLTARPDNGAIAMGVAKHALADWWDAERGTLDQDAALDMDEADKEAMRRYMRAQHATGSKRQPIQLPPDIRRIAEKKTQGAESRRLGLQGEAKKLNLTNAEKQRLKYWRKTRGRSGPVTVAKKAGPGVD